jgi:type I restriction-modification system DNA methylase subunit
MPNDLDTRFWRACDILRRDDNTQGLLDYVEQISWLLFLKSFEDLEDTRADEAEYEGHPYARVIEGYYRWSVWTGGRVARAQAAQREAEGALRAGQKTLLNAASMLEIDPEGLAAAREGVAQDETALGIARAQVESEQGAQQARPEKIMEGNREGVDRHQVWSGLGIDRDLDLPAFDG